MINTLDLHMHTNISDGTDTPAELIENVIEAGLDLFSVTDHDALEGCDEIARLLAEDSRDDLPLFIPGIEFSCRDEEGKYHILGYHYRKDAPEIRALSTWGHQTRLRKLEGRLAFLRDEYGFTFSEKDIAALRALSNPGKPHIAKLMVKYGYAGSINDAIHKHLNNLKQRFPYLRPEQAIEGICQSGGIPVLAHPSYGNGDQIIIGEDMEIRLKKLIGFGLRGVEAYYSGFTPKLTNELLGFAERFDLLVTAGSDYHGSNKMISLGEHNLPESDEWVDGLKRFLSEIRS